MFLLRVQNTDYFKITFKGQETDLQYILSFANVSLFNLAIKTEPGKYVTIKSYLLSGDFIEATYVSFPTVSQMY